VPTPEVALPAKLRAAKYMNGCRRPHLECQLSEM
jgi:hypothetical protein